MSQNSKNSGIPFIPASSNIPEITVRAVILGLLLAVVLAAANAYLGLYAGLTVSASIPAAVISMGILRGLLRTGSILENNIVQTIASTGESLAAGVIFTIPAMLIAGVWTEIQFWPTTLIAISGGLLGIIFMIPLRKSHIVDDKELTFPEGVACAEVLKAGERGGGAAKLIMYSMGLGALFKFFVSGVSLIKGGVEWAWVMGKTAFFVGSDISVALMGVGYIVGFNISMLVFIGGFISWGIAIPYLGYTNGVTGDPLNWFWQTWSTQARYLGVGSMIVGGIWSIFCVRQGIIKGIQEAILGYKKTGSKQAKLLRTEINMDRSHILMLLVATIILVFFLYNSLIGSTSISIAATIAMVIMSFFFVAVASYIVGLVGSSNSPVSGMTICAVLFTGGFLLILGMTGVQGIIATLGVAGVVCCAACSAGDISQDLKTGYLLGATPKRQQWMEVLGVIIPAFVMAPVLIVLHSAYGIGTEQPGALKAPQATLFASLVNGLFGRGDIPWGLVIAGSVIGVVNIVADEALRIRKCAFRLPVMAVAVGMYLPISLAIPMLIGGAIASRVKAGSDTDNGTLFASGLIAGEAVLGVLIGTIIYFKKGAFPINIIESDFVSVLALLAVAGWLYKTSQSKSS